MTLTNLNNLINEHPKLWCVIVQNPAAFSIVDTSKSDARVCCAKWSGSRPIIEKYNLTTPSILKFENGNLIEITPIEE